MTKLTSNHLVHSILNFVNEPTSDRAWEVNKLMVQYQEQSQVETVKPKAGKIEYLKTNKGDRYDPMFREIQDLFYGLGWKLEQYKNTPYFQSWSVKSGTGDTGFLYLDNDGFTMSSGKTGESLKGEFEGLDGSDSFVAFLSDNNIEVVE